MEGVRVSNWAALLSKSGCCRSSPGVRASQALPSGVTHKPRTTVRLGVFNAPINALSFYTQRGFSNESPWRSTVDYGGVSFEHAW